ncbi:enoyl-CoA hydratase/isomerase family protein [Nocardia pseudovaccinii]|uniref:enoyl-CoA hydratase/isomerase family protein n=1 Tax=Nocardia pseudovaccinii TaxID=189540 RepID=UPI003D89DE77
MTELEAAGNTGSNNTRKAAVLQIEHHGQVVVLTMNRPEQRNALNRELRTALRQAFDSFEEDPALRCAVLTGNGPAFCAGADLKEMAAIGTSEPGREAIVTLGSNGKLSKPVIAAVNGYAMAAGFRLAQDCDLAIAADTAQFAVSEVKRGRGSPWAVPLISMLPKRIMMELLITGETIDAGRAYEVGLVNQVVPAEGLLDSALRVAEIIAHNAPLSVWAAKQMVEMAAEHGQDAASRAAHHIYHRVYASQDAAEGPRAFAEKRRPIWSGR